LALPLQGGHCHACVTFRMQNNVQDKLRSLVKVGYLSYGARARTYLPAGRVPLLGNWVGRPLFQPAPCSAW
jgi:hypothetical protein